ncbi:PAS domain-containing protein, partial [Streptomyces sp. M2CJ-2]|uniref:PAS domain-containing protein n=1 Tax=Streptomyces sp. M2CJ-2 TaxID=2803948 RepID=UPI0019292A72
EVNEAYLRATGRTREELSGRYFFDAYPENPADPDADGVRNLQASLRRVLRLKEPDTMAVQKYDIPVSGRPGGFREKWWSPVNTPVLGADGEVQWILHRVEDMTEFALTRPLRLKPDAPGAEHKATEAELFTRA